MEDASFETLDADELQIRRFNLADVEPFVAYRNDPDVARYQGWDVPYTAEDAARFIAGLAHVSPGRPGTWFQFAVSPLGSMRLIGAVGFRTPTENPLHGELGFSFAPMSQGRGYATRAVRAVARFAFERLDMHRLFAITDTRNVRAQGLLERVDFQLEQELGEDALLYSLHTARGL